MPPRMRTQSAGRPVAESRGRGMGERVGRGRRGRRPREGNDERVDDLNGQGNDQGFRANGGIEGINGNLEGVNGGAGGAPDFSTIIAQQLQNLLPAMLAQVGNQVNVGNQSGNVVNENVQENVGNVIVNGNRLGCSYKKFLACNPKEYDGKGGGVVLTYWIEKMESVHDMSGCSIDQKVKYTGGSFVEFCPSHEMQKLESELWNHAIVEAGHAAYTDRFYEFARLVPHLVTPESRMIERYVYGLAPQIRRIVAAIEPKTIQKAVHISGALADEVVRNGSIKKVEKRGNVGEPSKDKNGMDDNKRTRTRNAFATTVNPIGRENTGTWPKCTICNSYHAPRGPCRTCFNCNRPGHLVKDCRGVPRNVNHVNARNPTVRACYKCGSTDHVRLACPRLNRAQGPEENCPNQVAANNEGMQTRFWEDLWLGEVPFNEFFPRLYALENNKECSVAVKMQGEIDSYFRRHVRGGVETQQLENFQELVRSKVLSNVDDRWAWDLNGDGDFCVKDARDLVDEVLLLKENVATRWIKTIPIKVNVFAWKLHLDRLPTRSNILKRGIQALGHTNVQVRISETGWPSKGDVDEPEATIENVGIYNRNLLQRMQQGQGTPAHPSQRY
ncbi:putative reverse transcriptase domain-containing protein [Tanacetum coccineum]